ncbi:MAG: aminotransferase class I/II-fold pyridoxal phosphate-dependent enzyme [Proteobacteria bacterium]|nr:aminotransferase class I/II-fold pyridoxal phosphate-dependent enzyme [Pseudomonadota bacterium]
MNTPLNDKNRFGLASLARAKLVERYRGQGAAQPASHTSARLRVVSGAPDTLCRFEHHPAYEKLLVSQAAAKRFGVDNPFFRVHDGVAGATSRIGGREHLNFSSYNYLGLSGHPRVNKAAKDAIDRYGSSPSASRLVAGERPIQRQLEEELAAFYGVEACVAFVSGHATNVSTIGSLFGPKDLVLHDALVHNSVLEGIKLSGAHRRSFAHNDWQALDLLLAQTREDFERVLVVIEGLYSMDGDVPDLPRFVEIKERHRAFLMVDEAHALGALGETGRGIAEYWRVPAAAVDIWMGTLSKTLAGCGGYIAGSRALVELLKYTAPGFVYSVGLSPALAAASLEALRIVQDEPQRVARLQENGRLFSEHARLRGLRTGHSQGHAITAAIVGSSLKATKLSNALFERCINVQPIIYPAVEEKAARLRFFLSSQHTPEQMHTAIDALASLL